MCIPLTCTPLSHVHTHILIFLPCWYWVRQCLYCACLQLWHYKLPLHLEADTSNLISEKSGHVIHYPENRGECDIIWVVFFFLLIVLQTALNLLFSQRWILTSKHWYIHIFFTFVYPLIDAAFLLLDFEAIVHSVGCHGFPSGSSDQQAKQKDCSKIDPTDPGIHTWHAGIHT